MESENLEVQDVSLDELWVFTRLGRSVVVYSDVLLICREVFLNVLNQVILILQPMIHSLLPTHVVLWRGGETTLWSPSSHLLWSGAYSPWTATEAKTPLKNWIQMTVSLPPQWSYLQLTPVVQIRLVMTKCEVSFNVNLQASKPLGSAGSLSSATTKFPDS